MFRRQISGSLPFWQKFMYEVVAVIKQLGIRTWSMTVFFFTFNTTQKLFTQKAISHVSKTALYGESKFCPSVQSAHGQTKHKNYAKLICNIRPPQSISALLYPKQSLSTMKKNLQECVMFCRIQMTQSTA